MSPLLILGCIAAYFAMLLIIAWYTSRDAGSAGYYLGNKASPWYIVAFGLIGDSLSGVTFISVPGAVGVTKFSYLQVVLGYMIGYVVIGAVLLPGDRAPTLVPEALVARMQPGSVIIDVAVDQGGSVETCRPTSHEHPTYTVDGVIHYAVPNMPGAVPRTSTYALTNATLPHAVTLATRGPAGAAGDPMLRSGINTAGCGVVHPTVATALGREVASLEDAVRA